MNLFYTKPEHIGDSRLTLEGQEARHAVKVLRHEAGDSIHVTDGRGGRYSGRIESVSKDRVRVTVENYIRQPAPEPDVTLAIGLIKKRDRLEFAVEKVIELGAAQIVIFQAEHSEKTGIRMDRLEMTALSAVKQSLRCWLPDISHSESLEDMLARHQADHDRTGVADERVPAENGQVDDQDIQKFREGSSLIVIGPEGGFSGFERDLM
ncbi:MAG: RsmE family RNA methyltransferase, partial [Balneolaceae bacterium]